jgi:uncharacterized protein (DUF2147 family)
MKHHILGLFSSLCLCTASSFAAQPDPLVGLWKTIDDRTGYSLADVFIKKDAKTQSYSAVIVQVRGVPGAEKKEHCTECKGSDKNKPLVGLRTLTGLTEIPGKNHEYQFGQLLDPKNGEHYNARARLMNDGKHLIIRSTLNGSQLSRNTTWVKN